MSENSLINLDGLNNDQLKGLMDMIINKRMETYERQIIKNADTTEKLNVKVENLEGKMTIDYSQQEELRMAANKAAIKAVQGYGTPAYKELIKKVFSSIWKDYKRVMNVNSYRNTAVVNYQSGLDFIRNWTPDRELELMIKGANSLANNGGSNDGI